MKPLFCIFECFQERLNNISLERMRRLFGPIPFSQNQETGCGDQNKLSNIFCLLNIVTLGVLVSSPRRSVSGRH